MNGRSPEIEPQRFSYRSAEKDRRRQRILEAAEAAFSVGGYHHASLSAIAREAGFAVGTIYLYFEDKADLYGSVLAGKMHQLVAEVEKAVSLEQPAPECLRAAVRAFFTFHDANRSFFELFLNQTQLLQASSLHARQWEAMETLKRRNLTLITDCVARGQAAGDFRAGDPHLYAVAFLGVVLQLIRQWMREKDSGRLIDLADFAADCFLHGAAARPA